MSVDLKAIREAGRTVSWIDQRIIALANRLFNRRLEGLSTGGPRVINVPFVMGVKGSALAVGAHLFCRLNLGGELTVLNWSLAATIAGLAHAGSVTIDVQTGATLAACVSIAGTGQPSMTALSEITEQPPAGWTATTIANPSWLYVTVSAVSGGLEVVSLTLQMAVG